MDLVGFDEGVFRAHLRRPADVAGRRRAVQAIPLSALHGDNVITLERRARRGTTARRCWSIWSRPTSQRDGTRTPFRFPVQLVVRPDAGFRGYAGQIASGTVRSATASPPGPPARRRASTRIVTWDGDLDAATAPMSVTLVLDDDLDVSRGDMLACRARCTSAGASPPTWCGWTSGRSIRAPYVLKQGTRTVMAEAGSALALNQIGTGDVSRPGGRSSFDPYADNRTTGSFILIDPATNFTAGAGMIVEALPDELARR